MKGFKQVHLIVFDKGSNYEKIPYTPDFYSEGDALSYWDERKLNIQYLNPHNYPIFVIRKEIHSVAVKEL